MTVRIGAEGSWIYAASKESNKPKPVEVLTASGFGGGLICNIFISESIKISCQWFCSAA